MSTDRRGYRRERIKMPVWLTDVELHARLKMRAALEHRPLYRLVQDLVRHALDETGDVWERPAITVTPVPERQPGMRCGRPGCGHGAYAHEVRGHPAACQMATCSCEGLLPARETRPQ